MTTITIDKDKLAAICALAYECARFEGEDVIGSLMKRGGFHLFEVVEVAQQVEELRNYYYERLDACLKEKKAKMMKKQQF